MVVLERVPGCSYAGAAEGRHQFSGGRQSGIVVNCFQDLAQDAEAADAGDEKGRCRSVWGTDRWTGADPIARRSALTISS